MISTFIKRFYQVSRGIERDEKADLPSRWLIIFNMDFSYVFRSARPKNIEKFEEFGFKKNGEDLVLKREVPSTDFYTEIFIQGDNMTAEVFDSESGEKYALLDVKKARGAFVSEIREKVGAIVDEIVHECFLKEDLKEKYIAFIESEFGVKPDYPWAEKADSQNGTKSGFNSDRFSDYSVFRCPNEKWFALVMHISYKNLGFESDERVFVVNLKADKEQIEAIVDKKSIFPAYHMNKKYWITALLTSATDLAKLEELTRRSYELVYGG